MFRQQFIIGQLFKIDEQLSWIMMEDGAIVEYGAMMDDRLWSDDHVVMILHYRRSDVINSYGTF